MSIPALSDTPHYPTAVRARMSDGRLVGQNPNGGTSMWLYRAVGMGPVSDAVSPLASMIPAESISAAIEELGAMPSPTTSYRRMARSTYRQIHMLLVNLPRLYVPGLEQPGRDYLLANYPDTRTEYRVLLFGVRLRDRLGATGGLSEAVESVKATLLSGDIPLSDFDADYEQIAAALARSGLRNASAEEMTAAEAWWNHGYWSDTPTLEHADHMHIFGSAQAVKDAARTGQTGAADCSDWPKIPNHHAITFATVHGYPSLEDRQVSGGERAAHWASRLVSSGAAAVSIRGAIEPSGITRAELRRNRRDFTNDVEELQGQGKMDRAEQTEILERLRMMEATYAQGGPATLIDASTVVAFDGRRRDLSEAARATGLSLQPLLNRQGEAMAETWLASGSRANPHLHDLPAPVVAYSGLPDLSKVGDNTGAIVGFTERDGQPAYLSPGAASKQDSLPICAVVGATGSGKQARLTEDIPTPSGYTKMGDIKVGDEVFGRDGHVCRVTHLSPIDEHPDLYEVELSDGQTITVDANHQWVVSDFQGRSAPRRDNRRAAIGRFNDFHATADKMDTFAASLSPDMESTLAELTALVSNFDHMPREPRGMWSRLDFMDCPSRKEVREGHRSHSGDTVPKPDDHTAMREFTTYPTAIAMKLLAERLRQNVGHTQPTTDAVERVMTTAEMLDEGIRLDQGHANFAIRVARSIQGSEARLAVDPYVLGAWLGDGSSNDGQFTQGKTDARTDNGDLTDQDHLISELNRAGYDGHVVGARDQTIGTHGLKVLLSEAGVMDNKHIPTAYLRASAEQRLAVLQGLMDTDGTVDVNGSCELCLSDLPLATDALELIRSLGIKASMRTGPAGYKDDDGNYVACKDRNRIHFTTDQRVFRLPRKVERLPDEVRETQKWLYVTDVTPAPTEPARCITVDSPDSTYLIADFVPTHNTMLGLHLMYQYAQQGVPSIFVDPKMDSDHSEAVLAAGGQVASLDKLTTADGVFDPMRFAQTKEVGVELAASMLMQVNPWGSKRSDFETPLIRALAYGADHGATCTGEALKIALRDGQAPDELVQRVFDLATSSTMFRACVGMEPGTEALSASEGITLVKVGSAHLDLPSPGSRPDEQSQGQRIAAALVRMMVFGSAMALAGRKTGGVVFLDEAWTFLGAGRNEVERLGRMARSQNVLPILMTQRVTDATDAELEGYISRGLILGITDPAEARSACQLFELEPTPERLGRITARATKGSSDGSGAPNWSSLRHLREPKTGETLRGAVAIYVDLSGRAVPVEVDLPEVFLRIASTNPDDVHRREKEQARLLEHDKKAREQAAAELPPPLPI